MGFHFFSHHDAGQSIAHRLIAEHARWLTQALRSRRRYPQIPVRKVTEGGFARLMATQEGRRISEKWWYHTLEKLD